MRLARAVLEQSLRHPAAREPTAEARSGPTRSQDKAALLERELHLTPGMEASTLAQLLRDDDLALGAQTMSHTEEV